MLDKPSSIEGKRLVANLEIECALSQIAKYYAGQIARVRRRYASFPITAREIMFSRADSLEERIVVKSETLDMFRQFCTSEAEACPPERDELGNVSIAAATDALKLLDKLVSLRRLVLSYPDAVVPRAKRIALEAKSL